MKDRHKKDQQKSISYLFLWFFAETKEHSKSKEKNLNLWIYPIITYTRKRERRCPNDKEVEEEDERIMYVKCFVCSPRIFIEAIIWFEFHYNIESKHRTSFLTHFVCARFSFCYFFFALRSSYCHCHLKNILCQFSKWIWMCFVCVCWCVCVSWFAVENPLDFISKNGLIFFIWKW